MIELTLKAEEVLSRYLKQDPAFKYVRLGVRGGGCSGFEYVFALTEVCEPEWTSFPFNNVTIVVDPMSLMYLDGTIIDYSESLTASGFTFSNPAVKTTCGCGQSFSV